MKGKYQKKKENTWETQKTKKIPKKNKKNSKINLAPIRNLQHVWGLHKAVSLNSYVYNRQLISSTDPWGVIGYGEITQQVG